MFEAVMIKEGMKSGFHVEAYRTLIIDGRQARCIQLSHSATESPVSRSRFSSPRVLVRCMIGGDSVTVFYEGSPQYLPEFFSILEEMKKAR